MKNKSDEQLAGWILERLRESGGKGISLRQMLSQGGMGTDQRRRLRRLLRDLVQQGRAVSLSRGRYQMAGESQQVEGVVAAGGRRWLKVETGAGLVRVRDDLAGGAQAGDRVRLSVFCQHDGGRPEARVEQILERCRRPVVGTLHRRGRFALLLPDDGRADPIVIEGPQVRRVQDGQVVAVVLDQGARPAGKLVEVLGDAGSFGCELRRLKLVHGLEREFPQAAWREAEQAAARPDPAAARLDLCHLPHVTIDPDDAKDFDDAIWLEKAGDGYRLLVSIADVASYVPAGGALDAESFRRGCSVYLPGAVVPMLPAPLSENLCSLVPGEPRRAQTVEMLIDGEGRVTGCRLLRTLIRSAARLTYRQVQQALDGEADAAAGSPGPMLQGAERCARLMLKQLKARGMLDLDLPESEISLGPDGRPLSVQPADRSFSHRLIEVMMIAANEQVAELMRRAQMAAIYRVHPPPDTEKLAAFRQLAEAMGKPAHFNDSPTPAQLGRYLAELDGPRRPVLSQLLLRSLMQASYSQNCELHYGLASQAYLHFTSPIRRYPDLAVHRQLARLLDLAGEEGFDAARPPACRGGPEKEVMAALAAECSMAERRAMTAEREAHSFYHAAFMQERVGEIFPGEISFVTDFGLFVVIKPHGIEGLVHISSMKDDYYRFLPERICLAGSRRRRCFEMGGQVRVRVEAARLWPPQIELSLAGEEVE